MFGTYRVPRPGAHSPETRTPVPGGMMGEPEASAGGDTGSDLLAEVWDRLEPILESFERALSRGERPALQDFLPEVEPAARPTLLAELAHAELEFRLKAGEPARVEDYLARHPELRANTAVLLDLIRAEYLARRQREPALGPAEYETRFPKHAPALAGLLAAIPAPPGSGR